MVKKKVISIICPVYNEEEGIESFYKNLKFNLENIKKKYNYEIIFVLDKSSDNSLKKLELISKKDALAKIILLSKRFGHQMSLVAGIDASLGDIIIMMDSDLQHPAEIIPTLLEKYEVGYDVVYTIRTYENEKNIFRKKVSTFFYKCLNKLSDLNLKDGEADFRLISRKVADVFKNNIREQNQFLRGLFSWVGFKRIGIHYKSKSREYGKSKYSVKILITFALSSIFSFSRKPLKYITLIGLIISIISIIYSIRIIFLYFVYDDITKGWSSLAVLITFFGGIQLIILGIIAEFIGFIFDEVKQRPLYIIDKKVNF